MTIALTKLQHSQVEASSKTKLQSFQRKIYLKAKQNPKYKFYCLYDKVFRMDTLKEAYERVKANKGTSGVDNLTWDDLDGKEDSFLADIHNTLKDRTYRPSALREIDIPKANGKRRTLRIPTIKDRVVQMAVKLIIEPIFEADFNDCSYGYRPKRSAHDAIRTLGAHLFKDIYARKKSSIQSIDLSDCFDTIPHTELMQTIAKRITDRALLKLIKSFLTTGITRDEGSNKKKRRGTPQGGVLSPLLANIYLNKADRYWTEQNLTSTLVRYADDMIVVLRSHDTQAFHDFLRYLEQTLSLTVNREKTHTTTVQQGVEYLGFTLRQKTSRKQKRYLAVEPSKKSMNRIRERIRTVVRWNNGMSTEDTIEKTNTVLCGWQQYFDNVCMGKTRAMLNDFTKRRVAKFVSRRNKHRDISWKRYGGNMVYDTYGLYKMMNMGRKIA